MTAEKVSLKCSQCNKEFKYDSERRRHEQSHFPQFQCKVCSKYFSFISALRRHQKQHERTGSVTCGECNREFRDSVLLRRHTKYAHGGSHTCTKCEAIFCSESALRTHMRTHKSEAERRYHCSFDGCTKKFNFAHHLKHHELTHTNSKQHYCKTCGKGFIQSHHLKTHLKTHNADSSLYCTFTDCNKKFATEYAKKRHMTKYHIKLDSMSSDSNSPCDLSINNTSNTSADDSSMSPIPLMISKIEHDSSTEIFTHNDDSVKLKNVISLRNPDVPDNLTIGTNDDLNCKLAVGTCIMSDHGEKCVCVDIGNNVSDEYDFSPIDTQININKLNINMSSCDKGGCCGGSCGIVSDKSNDVPEMYKKTDGTVKLKEFLDDPFSERNDFKFIPYNSCKAVLGKCIVSGNGTMDEGCLCAKMSFDEQLTSQEAEDITPQPKGGTPLVI